jgi:MFS family permease
VTGLGLVVAGGLVEGSALGLLQANALHDLIGRRRTWVLTTVLVAGLGWTAGSAPAALSGADTDGTPPLGLVLLGAAGLGLVMGALLGTAQATVLRRRVRHAWRWVIANACGWAVAMPVVFTGATTAGSDWSAQVVVGYGALTGALAGTGLGLVTGAWLPTLDGPPLRHRAVLGLVARRRHDARAGWTGLSVTGRVSGRTFRFPVMSAPLGASSLVVLPGHPDRKSWWRQLRGRPEIGVLDRGAWRPGRARVLEPGTIEWSVARSAYVARWPRVRVEGPVVVVDLELVAAADPR